MTAKKKEELELVGKYLSSKEALKNLSKSSDEEIDGLMDYGINQLHPLQDVNFADNLIKLAKLYPHLFDGRNIPKIVQKIEVE